MTTIITGPTAKVIRGWPGAVEFPEIELGFPLHPREIIDRCPRLKGRMIVTLSEHIILWFLREVREKRMPASDLKVLYVRLDGRVQELRVDEDGEFLDPWPDGFFDERGELLFT